MSKHNKVTNNQCLSINLCEKRKVPIYITKPVPINIHDIQVIKIIMSLSNISNFIGMKFHICLHLFGVRVHVAFHLLSSNCRFTTDLTFMRLILIWAVGQEVPLPSILEFHRLFFVTHFASQYYFHIWVVEIFKILQIRIRKGMPFSCGRTWLALTFKSTYVKKSITTRFHIIKICWKSISWYQKFLEQ